MEGKSITTVSRVPSHQSRLRSSGNFNSSGRIWPPTRPLVSIAWLNTIGYGPHQTFRFEVCHRATYTQAVDYRRLVSSVMTQGKSASMGLLALTTLASALAQTPADVRPPESGSAQREAGLSGKSAARSDCSAVLRQVDGQANAGGGAGDSCLSAREQSQLAERFVNEKLTVWSKRLNLEGWQISVIMTRRDDLKENTLGGVRWDKGKKSAVIKVQDASDYRLPFREMLDDMELTIVHELVHLELSSLPRSEASRSNEEHAVSQIAGALLGLDHQR
jgi:hypothetical protein